MITYEVQYRYVGLFRKWQKINNVKGDGLVENGTSRFFILDDESRIEIPVQCHIFKFSKERFYCVKERLDEEAGQSIQLKKK